MKAFLEQSSLPCRRFGRTGLSMPVLSLGGMRFQQSWTDLEAEVITSESQQLLQDILERAVAWLPSCGDGTPLRQL